MWARRLARTPQVLKSGRVQPAARNFSSHRTQKARYERFGSRTEGHKIGPKQVTWDIRTKVFAGAVALGGVYYVAQYAFSLTSTSTVTLIFFQV